MPWKAGVYLWVLGQWVATGALADDRDRTVLQYQHNSDQRSRRFLRSRRDPVGEPFWKANMVYRAFGNLTKFPTQDPCSWKAAHRTPVPVVCHRLERTGGPGRKWNCAVPPPSRTKLLLAGGSDCLEEDGDELVSIEHVSNDPAAIRVLAVDDHPLIRRRRGI